MFGKDLKTELNSELSGNLRQVVLALLETPARYAASELRKAMKGAGTDETALIEILCTSRNEQIEAIKAAYRNLYSRDLEKDIADDTSGKPFCFRSRWLSSTLLLITDYDGNKDLDNC